MTSHSATDAFKELTGMSIGLALWIVGISEFIRVILPHAAAPYAATRPSSAAL